MYKPHQEISDSAVDQNAPPADFKYGCVVQDWAPLTAGQLFEVCQAEVLFTQHL